MLRLESLQGLPIAGPVPHETRDEDAYHSFPTASGADSGDADLDDKHGTDETDDTLWAYKSVPGTDDEEYTNPALAASLPLMGEILEIQAYMAGDAPAVPAHSFGRHFPVKMQDGPIQRACCRCANLGAFGCSECGQMLCRKWRKHIVPDGLGGVVTKWRTCHGLYHSHADCHVPPVETRRNARPQLVRSVQDSGPMYMRHAPLSLKVFNKFSTAGTNDPRGFQPPCVWCATPTVFVCPYPECADVNGLPSALCWNTPGSPGICFVNYHESTPEVREQLKRKQRQRSDCIIADHAAYFNALAEYQ